jgi:hypothetical protein
MICRGLYIKISRTEGIKMIRKQKVTISPAQKLEYSKLKVEEGYTCKLIQIMSCTCSSAVARWKIKLKKNWLDLVK